MERINTYRLLQVIAWAMRIFMGIRLNGWEKSAFQNATANEQYKMVIEMPDGSTRKVKTGTSGGYLTGVVHQKYMDVVCAMTQQGSSTTYYCDEFIPSSAAGRVVFRSSTTRMRAPVSVVRIAVTIHRTRHEHRFSSRLPRSNRSRDQRWSV